MPIHSLFTFLKNNNINNIIIYIQKGKIMRATTTMKNNLLICLSVMCCVLFIIIIVFTNYKNAYNWIMPLRIEQVNYYINNIANGQFPDFYSSYNNDHAYGIYLIASYLGYFMNLDGVGILVALSVTIFLLLVVTIPFYVYKKTENVICACFSPILLCIFFYAYVITVKCEVYVVLSICVAFWGIPLLEKLTKSCQFKRKIALYFSLIFLISITNIARLYISLGLMIIVAVLLLFEIKKAIYDRHIKDLFIQIILLSLLFYLNDFFASSLPEYLIKHNNQPILGLTNTAWHNILIGFGTFNNPYNLYYDDLCGKELVASIAPNIEYARNEYYLKCKELVFELLKNDFWFCFMSLTKKTIVSIGLIFYALVKGKITFTFLLIFSIFYIKNRKTYLISDYLKDNKNIISYAIVLVLAGLVFSIITSPIIIYSFTSVATLYYLLFDFIIEFISKYIGRMET